MERKNIAFATSCYRIMLEIKRQNCISNNAIYSMTDTEPLVYYVKKRRLGFVEHNLRLPEEEPATWYAFYVPPHGKWTPGRPHTSYITYLQRLLGYHDVDISADEIATLAVDRCVWRNLVITCSAAEGWCSRCVFTLWGRKSKSSCILVGLQEMSFCFQFSLILYCLEVSYLIFFHKQIKGFKC